MAKSASPLQQYLAHYAEPELRALSTIQAALAQAPFEAALIIPAYNESPAYLERWLQHPEAKHHLLITVVNAPDNAENTATTQQLWHYLGRNFQLRARADNLYFYLRGGVKVLAVNRLNTPIPHRQGVGLARKIAADLSVFLHSLGCQQSPWIFSTDADSHLPDNYFAALTAPRQAKANTSAAVFNFAHIQAGASRAVFAATRDYEQSLKYFCQQLHYAASPYAFYTLGSTLAMHAHCYAQVRGFPKRAGGEDFYLLNKLAKIAAVRYLPAVTVTIEARCSQRVPFGTGPAVSKIMQQTQAGRAYHYYAPEIFQELKHWLAFSPQLWQYIHRPQQIAWPSAQCEQSMTRLKLFDFLQHAARQCKSERVFRKAFHDWFDAFNTLKFIHDMQRYFYPAEPLATCLQTAQKVREVQEAQEAHKV